MVSTPFLVRRNYLFRLEQVQGSIIKYGQGASAYIMVKIVASVCSRDGWGDSTLCELWNSWSLSETFTDLVSWSWSGYLCHKAVLTGHSSWVQLKFIGVCKPLSSATHAWMYAGILQWLRKTFLRRYKVLHQKLLDRVNAEQDVCIVPTVFYFMHNINDGRKAFGWRGTGEIASTVCPKIMPWSLERTLKIILLNFSLPICCMHRRCKSKMFGTIVLLICYFVSASLVILNKVKCWSINWNLLEEVYYDIWGFAVLRCFASESGFLKLGWDTFLDVISHNSGHVLWAN